MRLAFALMALAVADWAGPLTDPVDAMELARSTGMPVMVMQVKPKSKAARQLFESTASSSAVQKLLPNFIVVHATTNKEECMYEYIGSCTPEARSWLRVRILLWPVVPVKDTPAVYFLKCLPDEERCSDLKIYGSDARRDRAFSGALDMLSAMSAALDLTKDLRRDVAGETQLLGDGGQRELDDQKMRVTVSGFGTRTG